MNFQDAHEGARVMVAQGCRYFGGGTFGTIKGTIPAYDQSDINIIVVQLDNRRDTIKYTPVELDLL